MPSLSFKSVASSLKKAPRKLFKRSSKKNKVSISSPFNIIITTAPHWLRLTAVEHIQDDEPEALTSAEILDHLRLGLQRRLATAEKEESEEINHRSPRFAPRLWSIFELTERKPLEERLGGWKRSVEVLGEEAESSAEDIFSNFSDSESSFTSPPSTPTTGRYSPLFDSASVQSSPASSIVSLPLPAEHSNIAKLLFTSTSVTTTPKVDYKTTSRIPRLTFKSPTSTIGLGLGFSLPHDLRSSAEQVFGGRPRSTKKRSIYTTTRIAAPTNSLLNKPRPSARRSPPSFKRRTTLTNLPPRVFPISRTRFSRPILSGKSSVSSLSVYRRGRCGLPVRKA